LTTASICSRPLSGRDFAVTDLIAAQSADPRAAGQIRPDQIDFVTAPGDLVHVDIKKLGRIPDGGGHRKLGRTIGNRHDKKRGRGYAFVHHAVDDHSRMAYSEILGDERKETAAAFWGRANRFFAGHGITVRRVLTDNGSCYRSTLFAQALGPSITHKRTSPYRPQTNGKVERFNRTLNQEWAYAQTYLTDEARAATY